MNRWLVAAVAVLCVGLTWVTHAQDIGNLLGFLALNDPLTLISPQDPVLSDAEANAAATTSPPHLPPSTKFKLLGNATDTRDLENAFNEVISTNPQLLPLAQQTPDCAPFCSTFGSAYKKFGDHVKIHMLTNMIGVKYFFPPSRTCSGGSPRVQLGMDRNGDGQFDGNAFGYVGHGPFGAGCVSGTWDYVDLTDDVPFRWDLTQLGLGYHNWPTAVAAVNTTYPQHRVLHAVLVDDSGWAAGGAGCAYYDLFTAGMRTLDSWDDTSEPGPPNGCP